MLNFREFPLCEVRGVRDGAKALGANLTVEPHVVTACLIEAEPERKGHVTSNIKTCHRKVVDLFSS